MPKRKNKERGRPMKKPYPPRVDATAEEVVRAMFAIPADRDWEYLKPEPNVGPRTVGEKSTIPKPFTAMVVARPVMPPLS